MIQLICIKCNSSFNVYPSRLKRYDPKYCSMKCYKPRFNLLIKKTCQYCNQAFEVLKSEINRGNGKYCSKSCLAKKTYINKSCFIQESPEKRFFNQIKDYSDENICWEWTGAKDYDGYGQLGVNKKVIKAHRFSYELLKKTKLYGQIICHICDNPSCVNPKHLFAGTHKDNNEDMMKKGRYKFLSGEESPKAKFKNETIKIIRQRLLNGDRLTHIANEYNVSVTTIFDIKNYNSYKNVIV